MLLLAVVRAWLAAVGGLIAGAAFLAGSPVAAIAASPGTEAGDFRRGLLISLLVAVAMVWVALLTPPGVAAVASDGPAVLPRSLVVGLAGAAAAATLAGLSVLLRRPGGSAGPRNGANQGS